MATLLFTTRARADLLSIAEYTRTTWSDAQAVRYLEQLETCCKQLLSDPSPGRAYASLPPYWRIEQGKHVVFFTRESSGDVLIARILHQRMLLELNLDDDDDE